jgi:hypothetical protein
MDDPKEGHFGGDVCAPVFHDVAERCASYLNIPPDQQPGAPQILTASRAPAILQSP